MTTLVSTAGGRVHVPRRSNPPPEIRGNYLSVTTFRRDGRAVATPVWFVTDGDELLVQTGASSGKVKRIRRNPRVVVASGSARGRVHGPTYEATATLLPPSANERMRRLLSRKYRVALLFIRPIRAIQLRRHPERADDEVVLSIQHVHD
jgi:PPOX class probable F420-dependent enzyme